MSLGLQGGHFAVYRLVHCHVTQEETRRRMRAADWHCFTYQGVLVCGDTA